jgi:D-alanyl-D-alanine carboxypeptidase/D-alanyl-D-alanine-endopeptidase (penicillin-binding protein 4)
MSFSLIPKTMTRRICFICLKAVFRCLFVMCIASSVGAQQSLQDILEKIALGRLHKQATIGVAVYDVENGQCIAQLKKDTPLIPASSLKIITTFSGLQLLGLDYVYETRITHDGFITPDSTLKGNIYIEGSGDPTLGSSRIPGWPSMDELVAIMSQDIHRAGIRCIEGQIIADPTVFSSHPVVSSWAYADLGNYYGAGAWGLNVNENTCYFYFNREGKRGRRSKLAYCEPSVPSMQVESRVTLAGPTTGDRANIYGGPFNFTRSISGTIPRGKGLYRLKGSLPDPPGLFAYKVWEALGERDMGGYNATTMASRFVPKERRKLISHYCSPSMSEIVRHTNEMSINIYAESILKTIGWARHKDGAEKTAIQAIEAFIGEQGLDTMQLSMYDGSGLSRKNKVTPDFMAQFLKSMAFQKNEEYLSCFLPTAGENGTVRNLLKNSPAKGNVWVKSGSMRNILSYSGYCRTASGRLVSFSVILNNQRSRRSVSFKPELEKIIDAIYRFS